MDVRSLPPLQAGFCSASRCATRPAAPKAGVARTRGGTLAGGSFRIRGASGSERPRAAMSSRPVPVPKEIYQSAERGELQKVVKWLRKGGQIGAFGPGTTRDGRTVTEAKLHAAAGNTNTRARCTGDDECAPKTRESTRRRCTAGSTYLLTYFMPPNFHVDF